MQRILTIISCLALAASLSACKKDKEDKKADKPETGKVETPPKPTEEPVAKVEIKTPEDVAKRIQECIQFGAQRQTDKLKTCYGPDSTVTMVDFIDPMETKGVDAIIKGAQEFWKAFPDEGMEIHTLLVNDKQAVLVGLSHGTNTGEFMGMPATNNKVGVLAADHIEMNATGQMTKEAMFADQSTWMFQLMGKAEQPYREAMEKTGKPPEIVIAKGDETEANNVKLIKDMGAAFNAHDQAKVMEYYADDAKFVYVPMPPDHEGKKAIAKALTEYFKMSSDVKTEAQWVWGAGDYVVGRFNVAGTNDGKMHGMKATGKTFKTDELNVYKLQDGKIKEHWIFANGLKIAVQLGLVDPKEMMMQPPGGEQGAGGDTKAPDKPGK